MLVNDRTPGLAGARNTGILALDTDLVAFCDDDDNWRPGKLRAQVEALRARPGAEFASCGIEVEYAGATHPRLAGRDEVTHADLLRSRMVMVHSSTYLARRDGAGRTASGWWTRPSRAARTRTGTWPCGRPGGTRSCTWTSRWSGWPGSASSHYAQQWQTRADSLLWMLEHHPELADSRPGAARVYAQLSFAYACLRRRGDACRWAWRAVRSNWHERRVPFALAVASGVVSGETVLRHLNARGHGI